MSGVRQFDEAAIVPRMLEVFRAKGWQASSMQDLAQASQVQRGSLYHAFGSKQALFLRAFDLYAQRFERKLHTAWRAGAADDAGSAAAVLQGFFDVALSNMCGRPAHGCLTTRTAMELQAADGPIRQRLQQFLLGLQQLLAQRLDSPELRGQLRLPPQATAQAVLTFTRGLAVMERIQRERAQLQAQAQVFVQLLLR
ncbi:TetR/AcrR family transcriptional regulator [Vandammella animalimorsus]|uniref:TetR family transcriptional regulator n=1 Tax=Vandammella animalimorsus TaxID=2029117 RepID=A0A2A2ADG0_9BURK|nr:TetR/AcrR family transcriptional regulator [Vandammella animalimorsus]PAT35639.1 TetR family transcriptional regulator [Vandammella animalimorsus]